MEHTLSAILVTHLFVFSHVCVKFSVRHLSISHRAQSGENFLKERFFYTIPKLDPSLQKAEVQSYAAEVKWGTPLSPMCGYPRDLMLICDWLLEVP